MVSNKGNIKKQDNNPKIEDVKPKRAQKKILIMGLHKSGKTSIILCMQGNPNLMSFYNIKPTLGVNIQNLKGNNDQEFVIWEMGGQDKYREKYFEDFARYTDETAKIIFIIDVQDQETYEKALEYLKQVVNEFLVLTEIPELSIFLHKYDPNIEQLPEYADSVIQKRLIDPIVKIIPKNVKYDIYKTTIYTIFKKEAI